MLLEWLEARRPLAADAGVLTVMGDRDSGSFDDTIVVQPSSTDPSMLEVVVNGTIVTTRSTVGLRRIVIAGGRGDDTIRIDAPNLPVGCTIRGGLGNDTILGSPRGDLINGGEGDDTIDGGGGNDVIIGGIGNDYLLGGTGADRIIGGLGDDTIDGGLGNDALSGGDGADVIDGEAGRDVVRGDDGDDTLLGGSGRDAIFAGLGNDRLFGDCRFDTMKCDPTDTITESDLANPLVVAASEADIRRWLIGQATQRTHEARYGAMAFGVGRVAVADPVNGATPVAGFAPTNTAAAGGFSATNTQVAGVDEADSVVTDGRYIYTVVENELLVVDSDPASLSVVSRTKLEGYGHMIYLSGSRLTVLSQITRWPQITPVPIDPLDPISIVPLVDPAPQSTAAFADARFGSCMPWGPTVQQVKVTVLDVADPAAPGVVEETLVDGRLSASRSVEGTVYLVIENTPDIRPMPFVRSRRGIETPAEYRSRIASTDLESLLPVARTTSFGADGLPIAAEPIMRQLVVPGSLYLPVRGGGSDLVSVVSLNPTDGTPGIDHVASTLGMAGTVYASTDSIILASCDPGIWWGSAEGSTTLHEFALSGDLPYLAGGTVPGRLLDQFSIDAHSDGTTRVVTQTGWGDDAATNLFVLDRDGQSLDTVGSVVGIGRGENTQSVRFLDDTAYIVTFRQVDPLFVVDLSDPTQPAVVGELVMPGFSTYLHPVDATHLIGLGVGASPGSLKISLFDVSKPASPLQVDAVEIGGAGCYTWSAAQWDHHAFSYFADRRILSIPVSSWTWTLEGGSDGSDTLAVYAVDPVAGFRELSRIDHDSPVSRSLRIGDRLYSISGTTVKIVDFADPSKVVGEVPLG